MDNKKEKGFSLVELIIVIAISSVLLVAIGLSINVIFSNKAKSVSRNVYNMLGTAQNLGMSKNKVYFCISSDNKGNITASVVSGNSAADLKTLESKDLGNKTPVKLVVGTDIIDMSSEKSIFILVDRKTGGLMETYTLDGVNGIGKNHSLGTCTQIDIGVGSNYYGIKIYPRTGKIAYL